MTPDPRRAASIRPLLVALLGVAGAVVFAIAIPAWLVLSYADITWQQYRTDLMKGSLTVGTGLVLTVVVAMLVENHRQRAARRSTERDLRRALIAQLRAVHDDVKVAALLIEAHQSARTYIPWSALTGPAFARLKVLRAADKPSSAKHEAGFSRPLGRAIDLLRRQNAERL
jgi:hypothetical protein